MIQTQGQRFNHTHPAIAQLIGLGFSFPDHKYSQNELAKFMNMQTGKTQRFFTHPHIETRRLSFASIKGPLVEESTGDLLQRFKTAALKHSHKAAKEALLQCKTSFEEIDFLCCVTSTGFLVPGLSALLLPKLNLRPDCQRLDVVGMGCNAGLNGLQSVVSWCKSNPTKKALLICCEISSAIYSLDDSEETALVNSLFADGTAAAVLQHNSLSSYHCASVLAFESLVLPDSLHLLRFDWDNIKHRFRFFVGKETPQVLAAHIDKPLERLLKKCGVSRNSIKHWVLHSGGAAILDAIEDKLHLQPSDLRHTRSVLKHYGNISSGSFLLSLDELTKENCISPGDFGVMATMGPGLTIEMALVQWR